VTLVSRRELLRGGAMGAAVSTLASEARASAERVEAPRDAVAMLYDTTKCIGCQACVSACAEVNGLKPDTRMSGGVWQMPLDLNSQTKNIIKLFDDGRGQSSYVKKQCMHCLDPACVAGCPFEALKKSDRGVVSWTASACIGCRYCEVACPFDVPKFEWDHFNPKIVKCEFCREERLDKGQEPACTSSCPTGAVIFGTRERLLDQAHARLKTHPASYVEKRVYGENEAGGTQVLYLSHVPFEKLGLPALDADDRPGKQLRFQVLLYKWLLFPFALYALIAAVIRKRWRAHEEEVREIEAEGGPRDQL
jgi:formate dehydrogenase beta subunit